MTVPELQNKIAFMFLQNIELNAGLQDRASQHGYVFTYICTSFHQSLSYSAFNRAHYTIVHKASKCTLRCGKLNRYTEFCTRVHTFWTAFVTRTNGTGLEWKEYYTMQLLPQVGPESWVLCCLTAWSMNSERNFFLRLRNHIWFTIKLAGTPGCLSKF